MLETVKMVLRSLRYGIDVGYQAFLNDVHAQITIKNLKERRVFK
jgi:hypothetical protein